MLQITDNETNTSFSMELAFLVLFASLTKIKKDRLKKAADAVVDKAKSSAPATLK